MIEDNIVEEIKSRLDIVDIISDYAELKKAGSNFKALCPFHSEKTPSFMVSPQKQIFHCFGCGAGGDIFGFIMRYENVPFPEALQTLAEKAGLELKKSYARKADKSNETLYQINEDAARFFVTQLEKESQAREYVKKRGLDKGTRETFRLGYAPPTFDALLKHLKAKGYQESDIEKSGLIKYSDRKKPYDLFRGRIMFPIVDIQGKIIAFGARVLDAKKDPNIPKYINSPETAVFKKSFMLYGMNSAHRAIRDKDYALVVEGYTDVIICHQFGFKNAIAPLGTALTEGQLKKIRAYTKKILLVFDADEAGLKAAKRSMSLIYERGLRAKALILPKGSDPDSFLNREGADSFQKLFPQSKDIVEFYLHLEGDRTELIRELIEISSKMPDAIVRGQIVKEISQRTSIPDVYLTEEIQKFRKKVGKKDKKKRETTMVLPEELLMSIAFADTEYAKGIIEEIEVEDIEKNVLKDILLKVKEMGIVPSLDTMSSFLSESEISYITSLAINTGFDKEKSNVIIEDCFEKLRKRRVDRKIEKIDQYIKIAESSGDTSKVESLLMEKLRLKRGD